MARISEFKIAQIGGITNTARGIPVIFKIGEREIKFMIQYDDDGPRWLTHYASGYKFGVLDNAETELVCKLSTYHKFSKRQLAEFLINKAITKFGEDGVLAKLDSVPVINTDEKE